MSYVLRFISNSRKPESFYPPKHIHLRIVKLRQATESIIKVTQRVHLDDEIQRVVSNQSCKRIGNLRPVLENGLIRVGGRLDRSKLLFAAKHQLFLPDKDPVTRQMINALQIKHLHVGQNGLVSDI